MSADVDNIVSETTVDECCSRLFTVQSLTGHNGIVTAIAMSESVLVTGRCVVSVILQHWLVLIDISAY